MTMNNLKYIGNCTMADLVDDIFGNVSEFARLVEQYGDNFTIGDYRIIYNANQDIHYFHYST